MMKKVEVFADEIESENMSVKIPGSNLLLRLNLERLNQGWINLHRELKIQKAFFCFSLGIEPPVEQSVLKVCMITKLLLFFCPFATFSNPATRNQERNPVFHYRWIPGALKSPFWCQNVLFRILGLTDELCSKYATKVGESFRYFIYWGGNSGCINSREPFTQFNEKSSHVFNLLC